MNSRMLFQSLFRIVTPTTVMLAMLFPLSAFTDPKGAEGSKISSKGFYYDSYTRTHVEYTDW